MSVDFAPFWYFINERHAIWLRKRYASAPRETTPASPYDLLGPGGIPGDVTPEEARNGVFTCDSVLGTYKFCNVFRELDRVTLWIDENIRKPFADNPNLWIMLAIARYINWPPTLRYLIKRNGCWPSAEGWIPADLSRGLAEWKETGAQVETGAYMIRAESNKKAPWYNWPKQRYIAEIVIGRLWEDRDWWKLQLGGECRLEDAWKAFQQPRYIGWGPFMAFQVVLDWRHTRILDHAPDRSSWAAIGPGSMRGLNRLHGRPVGLKLHQEDALAEMKELLKLANLPQDGGRPLLPHVPPLEMEDVQNSLCETDKYIRAKTLQGRPRSKYVPGPREF